MKYTIICEGKQEKLTFYYTGLNPNQLNNGIVMPMIADREQTYIHYSNLHLMRTLCKIMIQNINICGHGNYMEGKYKIITKEELKYAKKN